MKSEDFKKMILVVVSKVAASHPIKVFYDPSSGKSYQLCEATAEWREILDPASDRYDDWKPLA